MLYPTHTQYFFSQFCPLPLAKLFWLHDTENYAQWELESEVSQTCHWNFFKNCLVILLSNKSEKCMESFHFSTEEAKTLRNAEVDNAEQRSWCLGRTELL